jgi:hypothetical protein
LSSFLYTLTSLQNYVGSVAASSDGSLIAVSSPEGNRLVAITAASGQVAAIRVLDNGCGLAADGAGFIASSGEGALVGFAGSTAAERRLDFRFDNHLRRVG